MANETERQKIAYSAEMQRIAGQRTLADSLPLFFRSIGACIYEQARKDETSARARFPLGYSAYSAEQARHHN